MRRSPALFLLTLLLVTGCAGKKTQPSAPQPEVKLNRPSAALGLYVSHYLGGGALPAAASAVQGVEAATKIIGGFNPLKSDDTMALLQEYVNLLQIDVPDLLNRSTDRPTTLTQYTDALSNITTRAQRMVQDLQDHAKNLQDQERAARTQVTGIQKSLTDAFKTQDFATAGTLQKDLNDAQVKLTQITTEERQNQNVLTSYQKTVEVGKARIQAIQENREILIAGLKVVNLPGTESLGVLQQSSSRRGGNSLML